MESLSKKLAIRELSCTLYVLENRKGIREKYKKKNYLRENCELEGRVTSTERVEPKLC